MESSVSNRLGDWASSLSPLGIIKADFSHLYTKSLFQYRPCYRYWKRPASKEPICNCLMWVDSISSSELACPHTWIPGLHSRQNRLVRPCVAWYSLLRSCLPPKILLPLHSESLRLPRHIKKRFLLCPSPRNRQFHISEGESSPKTLLVLPCYVHSPATGVPIYRSGVGVDCLFRIVAFGDARGEINWTSFHAFSVK